MTLYCAPCTDTAITDGHAADSEEVARIPEAFTMAPSLQTFSMGGQQIAAPLALPVCYRCREKQLGRVSRTGLVTA